MNRSIKIILLSVAVLAAVVGVMSYYRTVVSPPGKLVLKNQYINAVKEDIDSIKYANVELTLDNAYVSIIHDIDFMLVNSYITEQERDELLESFSTHYIPQYVAYCKTQFANSIWSEPELQRQSNRITELQSLVTTDGKKVVGGNGYASLNWVHGVIKSYYAAKSIAIVKGYNGISAAKIKINTAKNYANMSPLNNCRQLVDALNDVPYRLEKVHYAYLIGQVERLRYWRNYTEDEYDEVADYVFDKLKEYEDNANSVYGCSSNIKELKQRAQE